MSSYTLEAVDAERWEAACANWPGRSIVQHCAYTDVKCSDGSWAVERLLLHEGSRLVAACQTLIRQLPVFPQLGGLAWINRGPLMAPDYVDDNTAISSVFSALRTRYAEDRGLYLRIAPAQDRDDATEKLCALAGFRSTATTGWSSATVDLIQDQDALRSALKQKWRNTLNRAERVGMQLETGEDNSAIDGFAESHDAFMRKNGFETTLTGPFIRKLANYSESPLRLFVLKAVDLEKQELGATLLGGVSDTIEYLAGNTTEVGRRAGAGQFLLWHGMVLGKMRGYASFDVGGMDPNLTPQGIYNFKAGLGGAPYSLANEYEAFPRNVIAKLIATVVRQRVETAVSGR